MLRMNLVLLCLSAVFCASPEISFAKGDSGSSGTNIRCGRKGMPNCGIRRPQREPVSATSSRPHEGAVWCSGTRSRLSSCFRLNAGVWEYSRVNHSEHFPDEVSVSKLQLVSSNLGQPQSFWEPLQIVSPQVVFVSSHATHEIFCHEGVVVERRTERDPVTGTETSDVYRLAPRSPWHGNQTADSYFQRGEVNPYWEMACPLT